MISFMLVANILTVRDNVSDVGIWPSILRIPSKDVVSKLQLYNVYVLIFT